MPVWRTVFIACLFTAGAQAEARPLTVTHSPEQPKPGDIVRITVSGPALGRPAGLKAEYQVVAPGQYLELSDPAYKRGWVPVPLTDGGLEGDAVKDDGTFTAQLPASLQQHRHLIRYRIATATGVVAPAAADAQPNFAYFVYGGVPGWRAAVNPARDAPREFSADVMRSVQVYHFIAAKSAVENTTWYEPSNVFEERSRHRYGHTCTIVAEGKAYDHVRFRVRGGEWRHAMGKNMWKFDFPRGHHFQARDDFGRAYRTKWEKLNLGACIQQGSYGRRGEHGLYEAVTYGLFNLAGVPAPRTHFVHLRIIDEPAESPASQYEDDFWGLYLATEELDDSFLEEHGLPDGNLYKWDFGQPKPEHLTAGASSNRQDVSQFVAGYQRQPSDEWWRQHLDLPRYFSYRSILECVHHYDVAYGKNYFYYLNPRTRQWMVLPWDVDLTWKNAMYGTGEEPFHRAGLLRRPPFQLEYQNRLRSIRDLLFNPQETGALIDELAAVIADPKGGPSFVDADRARWDYHPIMASRWVSPVKAGQGRYYVESPTRDFRGMLKVMKDYIVERGQWCDSALLTSAPLPSTPVVTAQGPLAGTAPVLRFAATRPSGEPAGSIEWRLAEVTRLSQPGTPRRYEIEPVWEGLDRANIELPAKLVESGRTYRVRARLRDAQGLAGHWSAPVEFTAGPAP